MAVSIVGFKQERFALLLANYLEQQGYAVSVEREGEFFRISAPEDADIVTITAICEAFIKQPNDPKYQQAAWTTEKQVTLSQTNKFSFSQVSAWFSGAPLTLVMLLLCAGVYLASIVGAWPTIAQSLRIFPLSQLAESHEWWRLITPAFIHFSILHVVFNLLWWTVLGKQIERTLGTTMLFVVFAVSALASNVAQLQIDGPNFGGLSGVVYAQMGFVWICGWLRPQWGLMLPKPIIGFMLFWLVMGYADILWVSMANTAHTIGLVSGCALAAILATVYQPKRV